MAYYLPSGDQTESEQTVDVLVPEPPAGASMADLKIFWGPDICRLEYLVHLRDTGRIKEETPAAGEADR